MISLSILLIKLNRNPAPTSVNP